MTEYIPSPRDHVREQVELYEATDGVEGYRINGYPCIILTYRGRRTGGCRKTPLIRVIHEGQYVLVGSYGGRPKSPLWVANLLDYPAVTVRDRAEVFEVRARVVDESEEYARVWRTAVDVFPSYEQYQEMTERLIPVFVCEPR